MKKILIRKLGVGSVAKYVGIAAAILAIVEGVFGALAGTVAILGTNWNIWNQLFAVLGTWLLALAIYPVLAFAIGWVYGAVVALITNFFLQSARGIEIDVEEEAIV